MGNDCRSVSTFTLAALLSAMFATVINYDYGKFYVNSLVL